MQGILTRPTWQIFLLWLMPVLFPSNLFGYILTIFWFGFMSYCVYLLCTSLYQRLPYGHDLNIQRFKFHYFFVIIYFGLIFLVFDGGYEINQDNYKDYGWTIYLIIPLHILMMYSIFYTIWFIAKSISTIEKNGIVKFDTYAGNFFLLCLSWIGIWWIHPKVRKIFSSNIETTEE